MQSIRQPFSSQTGFSLIELVISLTLSSILVLGVVQIVTAASSSFQLQDNQSELLENGRLVMSLLGKTIRQAGYSPKPWDESISRNGILKDSMDQASFRSDRLALQTWSDRNCFGNRNPYMDRDGRPAFYLRENVFDLNGQKNLTHTCRFGPGKENLITQIKRQGLVENVESFQVLYGEDITADGNIDRWSKAGEWFSTEKILAIKIGFLLRSSEAVSTHRKETIPVLDHRFESRADGYIRKPFVFTTRLSNRPR